jgi:MFS family permease
MIRSPVALLVVLTGLNFLCYIDRILPAPLQLPLQLDLGLSNFSSGVLQTAFLAGFVTASPLFGTRAASGSRQRWLALGVLVWSLATVACGFSLGLATILLARLLVGLGEAAYATLAPTLVDDLSPPERKARNLAVFYLAVPVGSACGYLLGGFLEARWGWRTAFIAGGVPGIGLALLCLLLVEPARQVSAGPAAPSGLAVRSAAGALWAIPMYRRSVLGYCFHTGAIGAFGYWAPKFLVGRYRMELEAANFWFGLITVVAGFIAILLGGRLGDRAVARLPAAASAGGGASHLGAENRAAIEALLRICGVGMWIATPVVVATFWAPTPLTFFALEFLAQLGLFVAIPAVSSAMLRAVPPELRSSAMAINLFCIHVFGDLWTPPAVGVLMDVMPMQLAMLLVPAVLVVGASVWWPLVGRRRVA